VASLAHHFHSFNKSEERQTHSFRTSWDRTAHQADNAAASSDTTTSPTPCVVTATGTIHCANTRKIATTNRSRASALVSQKLCPGQAAWSTMWKFSSHHTFDHRAKLRCFSCLVRACRRSQNFVTLGPSTLVMGAWVCP